MVIPKKSLSQNFLIDKNISKKIIKLLNIKNENIVEIGPGMGALTDLIINEKPKELILIEKDTKLFLELNERYKKFKNIKLVNKDCLKVDYNKYKDINIISNLPYNISTKIILKFLKSKYKIKNMIFMVQKEVAIKFDYNIDKINKYKFINKLTSNYSRHFDVSPNVFFPKPKVESTVVNFNLKKTRDINWNKFNEFSNNLFINKRKKIKNKISKKSYIPEYLYEKRIDEINFEELLTIYNSF